MTSLEQTSYEPYKRYLLEIAYDGGNYSGWQIQPHCLAVQEVLQGILSKMYAGHPIHLIGSSRTDAGVHAQRFAAGYLTPKRPDIPPDKILRAVNRQLPADIKLRITAWTSIKSGPRRRSWSARTTIRASSSSAA